MIVRLFIIGSIIAKKIIKNILTAYALCFLFDSQWFVMFTMVHFCLCNSYNTSGVLYFTFSLRLFPLPYEHCIYYSSRQKIMSVASWCVWDVTLSIRVGPELMSILYKILVDVASIPGGYGKPSRRQWLLRGTWYVWFSGLTLFCITVTMHQFFYLLIFIYSFKVTRLLNYFRNKRLMIWSK